MKKISIGTWAYTIGPYAGNPIPWEEVIRKVKELGFDGVELGGFSPHPNPDEMADKVQRDAYECSTPITILSGWESLY